MIQAMLIQFILAAIALSFGLVAILYALLAAVSRDTGSWALIPPAFFTIVSAAALIALLVVSA